MKFWEEILKFNNEYFPDWRDVNPVYYSNALAGEVGEICNAVKHLIGGGTNQHDTNPVEIGEEGIDVLIYLVLLVEKLGINEGMFQILFEEKMEKLVTRMTGKRVGGKER